MNERQQIEGEGSANSGTPKIGQDEQRHSPEVGVEATQGSLLGSTPKEGGLHTPESEQGRQEADKSLQRLDWHFSEAWNKALEQIEERPVVARERLWASELGKPYIDVWLKLKGTPVSNPPNARSLRKFEAGNLFEWIVGLVLKRAGILQESQKWVSHQYEGLLEVTGKADFMAGGIPEIEKAKEELERMELPPSFYKGFNAVIQHLKTTYPNGLGIKPLEIKSTSAFMFDALERTGLALKIHRLQACHYLISQKMPQANIVYICRDDMRMMEMPVLLNAVEPEYRQYIEGISKFYKDDERPPLEKPIIFDEDMKKFSKNNQVAWSGYLTMLYGLKDQAEFDERYQRTAEKWNRVLGRVKLGKKMTPKNEEALKEVAEAGFDIEEIKAKAVVEEVSEEPE